VTFYLLFVMEIAARRIHFAGCTPNPDGRWMQQIARNVTDVEDNFLNGKRYVLMDRDGKLSPAFQEILKAEGTEPVLLPAKSPNLNAQLERIHRSIKEECLDRMIFFGEVMLRNAVLQFIAHYHQERNHQGLDNRILMPGAEVGQVAGKFEFRERLGGLLRYYYRAAA
jgi:transposase InsO family protein